MKASVWFALFLSFLMVCVFAETSTAQPNYFINPTGGDYFDPANWSLGRVPTGELGTLDLPGSQTLTFAGNHQEALIELRKPEGEVVLDLQNASFSNRIALLYKLPAGVQRLDHTIKNSDDEILIIHSDSYKVNELNFRWEDLSSGATAYFSPVRNFKRSDTFLRSDVVINSHISADSLSLMVKDHSKVTTLVNSNDLDVIVSGNSELILAAPGSSHSSVMGENPSFKVSEESTLKILAPNIFRGEYDVSGTGSRIIVDQTASRSLTPTTQVNVTDGATFRASTSEEFGVRDVTVSGPTSRADFVKQQWNPQTQAFVDQAADVWLPTSGEIHVDQGTLYGNIRGIFSSRAVMVYLNEGVIEGNVHVPITGSGTIHGNWDGGYEYGQGRPGPGELDGRISVDGTISNAYVGTFSIRGYEPGDGFDQIHSTHPILPGNILIDLTGFGSLSYIPYLRAIPFIKFVDGFAPSLGSKFPVVVSDEFAQFLPTGPGAFDFNYDHPDNAVRYAQPGQVFGLPAGYTAKFYVEETAFGIEITAVPEVSSLLMSAIGAAIVVAAARA